MERVTTELRDDVALLVWDDGKANTFSRASIAEANAALDRAADAGAKAIVLTGRPGTFSAGFDLKELGRGGPEANDLLRAGAGLLLRVYGSPIPVVAACTGHALGMGALLLLSSDVRIGADTPCKIALNESRISMHLPTFAVELAELLLHDLAGAQERLSTCLMGQAGGLGGGDLQLVEHQELRENIAGEGVAARPAGHPHVQLECVRLFRRHLDADDAAPGVFGALADRHRHVLKPGIDIPDGGFARREQVDVHRVAQLRVDVPGQGSEKTRHVRRAAGAGKPGCALHILSRFQGVGVKKAVALERKACI